MKKFLKKVVNLVNPVKWVEGFWFKKAVAKFAAGVTAFIGSVLLTEKVVGKMTEFGLSLNLVQLEEGVGALIAGAALALLNTAKHGPLKDEEKE